jgi:hypothetical protein
MGSNGQQREAMGSNGTQSEAEAMASTNISKSFMFGVDAGIIVVH